MTIFFFQIIKVRVEACDIRFFVANFIVYSSDIRVDVKIYDSSASQNIFLCTGSLVPVGSNLVLVGGEQKVVLEQNDYLTLKSNIASSADIIVSVLEIS